MTKTVDSDLSFMDGFKKTLNVVVESNLDIDDFVNELRGSKGALEIGEKLLDGEYGSIENLATGLSNQQMADLAVELLNSLPESMVEDIVDGCCPVCEERRQLTNAVEEIEEERNG